MTAPWWQFLLGVAGVFLLLNVAFAFLYGLGDAPVANAPSGFNLHLLYFSIETLSTVGYGDMHPQTHYGHVIASIEMFAGLVYAAVITGLIFARFARPKPRFVFADVMTVAMHDGRKTLGVRVANARHNYIANARAKLWLLRDEVTAEGQELRRFHALRLMRQENPTFFLSWLVLHEIDYASPLQSMSLADLEASDAAFILEVQGIDENSAQDLHARKVYRWEDVRWDMRYVDIITEKNGQLRIDYTLFHDVEPERR
jgi:inward rectifier potassium channel